MRKLNILWLLILGFKLQAQDPETASMSLQACIEYAQTHSYKFQNASIDEAIAQAKVGEIRSIGLPQINGSIGVQHNNPLRDLFLPPGGPFGPAGATDIIRIANIFQLQNAADASINISQLIFSSSYLVGLQTAKTYRELSFRAKEKTKTDIRASVTKAYYMVLINNERVKTLDINIGRNDSLLNELKIMYSKGFVEKIDLQRLEVGINNLKTEKEKASAALGMGYALLKFQMGMPLEKQLQLTDKLEQMAKPSKVVYAKPNPSNRAEYQQLETLRKLYTLDLKNNRLAYLPSIAASANLGTFTQNSKFSFFESKPGWANYALFQVGMNIPIFDGLTKMYKSQQSKLNLLKVENDLKSAEQGIELESFNAHISLNNSISSLESQQRNMDLATEIVTVTQKKYKQGVGSNLEVINAESSLKEAQINYYNALYDAIVAKTDYEIATGTLK